MPFDIFVTDNHGKPLKTIPLDLGDFETISELVKNDIQFPFFQKAFFDYYGDAEIFINDLKSFRSEIIVLSEVLNKVKGDLSAQLLQLVDFAIANRSRIIFAGD